MAIAQVTASTLISTGGTAVSMGSSANTVAFVFVVVAPGPLSQLPTINGVNMTAVGASVTLVGVRVGQWFYMINPPTGSQTVDPKNSSNLDSARCIVFSGLDQTTPVDSNGSSSNQTTTLTLTTTVVATGCWLLGACNDGTGTPTSAGGSFDNATLAGNSTISTAFSNAPVGTGSQSGTFVGSGHSLGGIILSIAPAAGGGASFTNKRALLGVGI